MIYKQFKDKELSSLGFGVMRLPATAPGYGAPIEYVEATKMLEHAFENGVNYFDTSYFYHDGDSERFLGKSLADVPRDKWYLASKIPGNLMKYENKQLTVSGKSFQSPLEVFEFQMDRCQVDYFDFFMLHNVSENSYDMYTNEELGIVDTMLHLKAKGRIKHLGFSSHGRHDTIDRFLNYLKGRNITDFEFGMIQMNYMDWVLQEANKKHLTITKHGLSVFVMEPLRGGSLSKLSSTATDLLEAARPKDSPSRWAFRFLQGIPNIPVILSGMSNMNQLKENIDTFSKHEPLSDSEMDVLNKVRETLTDMLPCTDCKYCMEECPVGLNIPLLLTMYDEARFEIGWYLQAAIRALKDGEKPEACTSCGKCAPLCPQNIDIPQMLKQFRGLLG